MSTPTPTDGQTLLSLIESDLLMNAGTPLLTLIEALDAANLNPFAIVAAWGQFVGNMEPALLKLEAQIAGQILAAIQVKLIAAMTVAQAKAAASSVTAK
jgi:hypothetical protein